MNKHQQLVENFMKVMEQDTPIAFSPKNYPAALRASLILEEANEFLVASQSSDFVSMIDAICDLLYVTYGAAVAMGIDIEPFFEEVHRSNMSKLDPETNLPVRREDGKILKPPTYSPADIKSLLLRLHAIPLFAQVE